MASSKVFVLLFVVIFVGFVCLLVSLRQSRSLRPLYQDDDDDDNSNATDVLIDFSKSYRTSCPSCPARSLRDHICDPQSFVVICSLVRVAGRSGTSDTLHIIHLISQLKQFPDITQSTIVSGSSIVSRRVGDSCGIHLSHGQQYVLTGRVDNNGVAVVTSCDVAMDWNAMPRPKQQSFFTFFSPILRC